MTKRDQSAVHEATEVAASVTVGAASLLWACRKIVELQHRLGDIPDVILDPIRAVESELDDVPEEKDARRWEANAFDRMMRARDEYLERVRPTLLECFRALHAFLVKNGSRS